MYNNGEDSSLISLTDFLGGPPKLQQAPPATSDASSPSSALISKLTGPELYEARRAEWLRPSTTPPTPTTPAPSAAVCRSHARLEAIVGQQGVEEDEGVWNQYLAGVHESLVGGKRLKKGIKLHLAVKILKAGWLRDGTWDPAAAATNLDVPPSPTGPSVTTARFTTHVAPSSILSSKSNGTARTAYRGLRALLTQLSPTKSTQGRTSQGRSSSTTPTPTEATSTMTTAQAQIFDAPSPAKLSVLSSPGRPKTASAVTTGMEKFRRMLHADRPPTARRSGREVTGLVDMMNEAPFPTVNKRMRTSSFF